MTLLMSSSYGAIAVGSSDVANTLEMHGLCPFQYSACV